jgi:hypothetical protein
MEFHICPYCADFRFALTFALQFTFPLQFTFAIHLTFAFTSISPSLPPLHSNPTLQRDPECGAKIRSLTSNNLTLALDTIATTSSAQICADAITSSSDVATYIELMGIKPPRADVRHIFFLGYTVSGEAFEIEGETWPAVPEDFELMKRFAVVAEKLLKARLVKPHPAKVREGLENILDGVQESKEGKVSGVKLVYRI